MVSRCSVRLYRQLRRRLLLCWRHDLPVRRHAVLYPHAAAEGRQRQAQVPHCPEQESRRHYELQLNADVYIELLSKGSIQ